MPRSRGSAARSGVSGPLSPGRARRSRATPGVRFTRPSRHRYARVSATPRRRAPEQPAHSPGHDLVASTIYVVDPSSETSDAIDLDPVDEARRRDPASRKEHVEADDTRAALEQPGAPPSVIRPRRRGRRSSAVPISFAPGASTRANSGVTLTRSSCASRRGRDTKTITVSLDARSRRPSPAGCLGVQRHQIARRPVSISGGTRRKRAIPESLGRQALAGRGDLLVARPAAGGARTASTMARGSRRSRLAASVSGYVKRAAAVAGTRRESAAMSRPALPSGNMRSSSTIVVEPLISPCSGSASIPRACTPRTRCCATGQV